MIMPKNKGEAEKVLREQGARVTPQRVAIFKAVESSGSHPDADAVYKRVSREYPHISRDTVYRTLSMMEEKKIIGSVLSFGNAKRYDPNTNKHDRLEPPASTIASFQIFRITVHVEGICDKCQGRKKA